MDLLPLRVWKLGHSHGVVRNYNPFQWPCFVVGVTTDNTQYKTILWETANSAILREFYQIFAYLLPSFHINDALRLWSNLKRYLTEDFWHRGKADNVTDTIALIHNLWLTLSKFNQKIWRWLGTLVYFHLVWLQFF